MYTSVEETEDGPLALEEEPYEEDDDEQLEARAGQRVRKEEIWREILATSVGRDKALVGLKLSGTNRR